MAEQKGLGSKILGIFVEAADEPQAAPEPEGLAEPLEEQSPVEADLAPPNLKLEGLAQAVLPKDFEGIFRDMGMDGGDLDRVKKAEDLLKSLPAATPIEVKKQIVEASLKAFGFELSKIVAAAQMQTKALDTYLRLKETTTAKAIQDKQGQIAAFNEKVAQLRGEIEEATAELKGLSGAAEARKAEVQQVVEFFQPPEAPVR